MITEPKKSLGQYLLLCGWVVDALIEAAQLSADDTVVEIGPGTGVLTKPLSQRVKHVIAVEKDDALADTLAGQNIENLEVIKGDILDVLKHQPDIIAGRKIVANIPYYLTSRLLRILMEADTPPQRVVLTIQKEVAERIVAVPPDMNLLALSVQAYARPRIVADVPAECFAPPPDVDSAIILLSDISDNFFTKNGLDAQFFFTVLRAAFGQKRKQLVNPLSAIAGGKQKALAALHAAGLDPHIRPQELSLDQWAVLVKEILKNSSRP
mgnify:FL=1